MEESTAFRSFRYILPVSMKEELHNNEKLSESFYAGLLGETLLCMKFQTVKNNVRFKYNLMGSVQWSTNNAFIFPHSLPLSFFLERILCTVNISFYM